MLCRPNSKIPHKTWMVSSLQGKAHLGACPQLLWVNKPHTIHLFKARSSNPHSGLGPYSKFGKLKDFGKKIQLWAKF